MINSSERLVEDKWDTSLTASVSPVEGLVGQSEWSEYFPDCGGTSQSPVNIVTTQTKYDPSLVPVTPKGYDQHGNRPFTLYNNGHTGNPHIAFTLGVLMLLQWSPGNGGAVRLICVSVCFSPSVVIELPEWMGLGGLPWLYTAVQLHLHWGSGGPSLGGSEHTINGQSAEAEVRSNPGRGQTSRDGRRDGDVTGIS